MSRTRLWLLGAAAILGVLAACADEDAATPPSPTGTTSAGEGGGSPTGTPTGAPIDPCEALGLDVREFDPAGPFGMLRHDVAADCTLPLLDGSEWRLSTAWSGCESYVFVPSGLRNSALDSTSIWARDVDQLILTSPQNVHYFFVATRTVDEAPAELAAMQTRIDEALAGLDEPTRRWWSERLHVVAGHVSELGDWPGELLGGMGRSGFAIDRRQQIRTTGNYADVDRFDNELYDAGEWPWEANLAYAGYEPQHYNYEAWRDEYLAAQSEVTIITPWDGEVLAEDNDTTVTLPDAAEMALFDTFEIDLTMDCPDPTAGEFGNCGAWDYLAQVFLWDEAAQDWVELARFVTPYHREGRYLVDATALLALLREGGTRELRFHASPPWNPQAYQTRLDLRFSNQGKSSSPSQATFLFSGGDFNSTYNDVYQPVEVPIPATAAKVELWALITGHGGDAYNCAEFCNHQHEFVVNGTTYTKEFPEAATDAGCVAQIDDGMVPNQGGTWWFGRGGWCPGEQVLPWVADVSASVTPGETATVSYEGLFHDQTPPDDAGSILMVSYLVVYE